MLQCYYVKTMAACSGIAGGEGGEVEARASGGRPWGRISTLLTVIQKRVLSRNLDHSMLKNAYFFGKI